jgi:iron complex outermembrane receptor protein
MTSPPPFTAVPRLCLPLLASLLMPPWSRAQTAPPPNTPTPTLSRVVVTGNPLDSRDAASPVSVLEGEGLVLRRGASLGATLDGLPGVSATAFGPNASRPVIRGLDGDRVRILENAGASLDASSLSFDHAVPIDPLVVERIEVLRGPAALLYGGSAIGGVVNTLDNRIPREPMRGTGGAAELRLGGAESERGGAALVETGNDRFGLHVDMAGRRTSDLRVPAFVPTADGPPQASTTRVANSASRSASGAVGGSVFFDHGYLGLSVDRYDSRYGIVAEPDVTIDLWREHLGLAGEWRAPGETSWLGWTRLKVHLNATRYQHQEVEGSGAVGTTFRTSGQEARIEATHAPLRLLGGLRGVLGAQFERSDFSALGEEAFEPTTRTRKQALFALEEMAWGGGTSSVGARVEQVQVASDGDADPAATRFGAAASRRFALRSASVGHVVRVGGGFSLTGSYSSNQRAPTSFELYANGLHAATGAYERGDPTLGAEHGRNLDLALAWAAADTHLRLGTYAARYPRFIALQATGAMVDLPRDAGGVDRVPEFAFQAVRARLRGVEFEAGHRWRAARWTVDVNGQLDLTRGDNLDRGEPLPRIAPLRLRLGMVAARGPWSARIEAVRASAQDRVPATDTATGGYTLVNLGMSRRLVFGADGARSGLWFLRLNNAGNRLAYSASAVQTVRGLAPLPGRALQTGVRVEF